MKKIILILFPFFSLTTLLACLYLILPIESWPLLLIVAAFAISILIFIIPYLLLRETQATHLPSKELDLIEALRFSRRLPPMKTLLTQKFPSSIFIIPTFWGTTYTVIGRNFIEGQNAPQRNHLYLAVFEFIRAQKKFYSVLTPVFAFLYALPISLLFRTGLLAFSTFRTLASFYQMPYFLIFSSYRAEKAYEQNALRALSKELNSPEIIHQFSRLSQEPVTQEDLFQEIRVALHSVSTQWAHSAWREDTLS